MNKKLIASSIVIATLTLIGLLTLLISGNTEKTKTNKIKILTTNFAIYDIAQNIVGNDVEVINMLPVGESEHTYSPTASDQARLTEAKIIFAIGVNLDNWAVELAENANSKINVVDLSEGIELKESEDEFDPHYWLSVSNAQIISYKIKTEISKMDPSNASQYEENYNKYNLELETLKKSNFSKINQLETKQIITFHDAFYYFAEENGLEIVTTIEEFAGQTSSPQYLAGVGEIIKETNVKVLFREPQLSDELVKALAKDYNIKVETLDPVGGQEGRDSYVKLINYNIDTIVKALNQ